MRRRLSCNLSLVIIFALGPSFCCCSLVVCPLSSLFSVGFHFTACAWCAAAASRMLPHRISGTAVWSFSPIRASRLLLKPLRDLGIIHLGYRVEFLTQASVVPSHVKYGSGHRESLRSVYTSCIDIGRAGCQSTGIR